MGVILVHTSTPEYTPSFLCSTLGSQENSLLGFNRITLKPSALCATPSFLHPFLHLGHFYFNSNAHLQRISHCLPQANLVPMAAPQSPAALTAVRQFRPRSQSRCPQAWIPTAALPSPNLKQLNFSGDSVSPCVKLE